MTSRAAPPFCSTSGKLPLLAVEDGGPDLWVRGEGAYFWDVAGKCWLDFDLCLGAVIWGHGRSEISAAASSALTAGGAPTVPSALEARAVDVLLRRLGRYEAASFFKTGAEACTAAVRLARRASQRVLIASDGFHGWHDWGIGGAYPADRQTLGVPNVVQALNLRLDPSAGVETAIAQLRGAGDDLAAAVFRPEAWEPAALQALFHAARTQGAWVVSDEMTSHFKYSRTGSASARSAEPDLLCLGKGLANGLPLAALVGPARLIESLAAAKISSTHSSETWSLAGMLAAEELLARAPAWPSWTPALDAVAKAIRAAFDAFDLAAFHIVQNPGFFSIERRGIAVRDDPFRRFLVAQLSAKGIYTRGWFHGSDAHTAADWERLEAALVDALGAWSEVQPLLAHQEDVVGA